jgi:hypothetical protein
MTLIEDGIIRAADESNRYLRNQAFELVEAFIEIIKSKLIGG